LEKSKHISPPQVSSQLLTWRLRSSAMRVIWIFLRPIRRLGAGCSLLN
jgi:hypothetical protein